MEIISFRRALLGESPLWHVGEQAFYWVDILGRDVFRHDPESGRVEIVHSGRMVTALSERGGGGLVMVTPEGILSHSDGVTSQLVALDLDERVRTNDGKTDPAGRLWFGTMDYGTTDPLGALYVYDGSSVHMVEGNIILSNGLGWSPDREVMYHTDTGRRQIYSYRYDPSSGEVGERKVLVDMGEWTGSPDGLAVDDEGNLWVAMYDGWCLRVIDSRGVRIHEQALEVQKPTSVAFGGPRLDRVYVTSASQDLSEQELKSQPHAGHLMAFAPGATGVAPGVFAG